jgi:Flp pilus assembly protein TadG
MKHVAEIPMRSLSRRVVALARRLEADQKGVAAIEFGIFSVFLFLAIVNVTDVSIYIYQRMQLENATQSAAQAAWKTCDVNHLPATTHCSGLNSAIQTAIASTSLGTNVSQASGSPSEGYYCVNSSNTLQYMSNVSSKPADCSAAGNPGVQPGDYIQITASFGYAPLFPGISIASRLATPITATAMMRLG